jgi:hypothetical protein
MPTQTLSNAVVDPQDPGTGIGDYDPNAAAIQAIARSHEQGEYVETGLQFANVDTTNDQVDLTAGYCYILDDSTSTAGSRSSGGQPQTMSTSSTDYDTEVPGQMPYVVVVPSDVVDVSLESGVNDVYISLDPTAQNAVTLHYGTSISAPSEPSLYLGTVDTSDGSTTSGDKGQHQDVESLATDEHNNIEAVFPNATLSDIQSTIDKYDKRDVTVEFSRGDYGTYTSPIGIGQLTKLVGEAALLDSQSGDEFEPRPKLTFSGSNGIQTPDGVSYRSQRPIINELTLIGDSTGGTAGIHLPPNSAGSSSYAKVGLPEIRNTYIIGFETGIDGSNDVDSGVVENVHFRNCSGGVLNFNTEARIERVITWEMNGNLSVDVGPGSVVRDCEFQAGNSSQDTVKTTGDGTIIVNNAWSTEYNAAIQLGSSGSPVRACVVAGNTLAGSPHTSVFSVFGSDHQIYGNTWKAASDEADRAIYIEGSNNLISETIPGTYWVSNQAIRIASGSNNIIRGRIAAGVDIDSAASDNFIIDPYLNWSDLSDSGTRTVLNNVGLNGSNDPRFAGDWNGEGYEGVVVRWDDGSGNSYASKYINGSWRDIASW